MSLLSPEIGRAIKAQYTSSEPLRLVFSPFLDVGTGSYVVGGADVTTLVVKKPDGSLLSPPTLVYDSDTDFWAVEVPVLSYMPGSWLVKATSDAYNTLPQYREFIWGDHVDTFELLRKLGTGRWEIDTALNVLRFYDEDGTTVLSGFDLTDDIGAPTSSLVFARDPV